MSRTTTTGLPIGGLVRSAVTISVIAALVRFIDWREAISIVRQTDPIWFLGSIGVVTGDRLLMIGKWLPLVRVHLPDVSMRRVARVYMASSVAGLLLPATIGDGILRATALGRPQGRIAEVVASVVIERLLAVGALAVICLGSLTLLSRTVSLAGRAFPWLVTIIVVATIATVLPMIDPVREWVRRRFPGGQVWWLRAIRKFSVAYASYRSHKTPLLVVTALSAVEQLFPVVAYWFLARSMGLGISFLVMVMTIPLVLVASRLPISLGGIGVTEGALVYLLVSVGVTAPEALALGLGARVLDLITLSPGVLFLGDLVTNGPQIDNVRPLETSVRTDRLP